jgi:septal ring factor EnvC (AmiA/AmiB activator)
LKDLTARYEAELKKPVPETDEQVKKLVAQDKAKETAIKNLQKEREKMAATIKAQEQEIKDLNGYIDEIEKSKPPAGVDPALVAEKVNHS